MLTVKALRALLEGLADSVIVAVECENRCDPHPLMGGKYAMSGPTERMVNSRSRDSDKPLATKVQAVILFSEDTIDLTSLR